MRKKVAVIVWLVLILCVNGSAVSPSPSVIKGDVVTISVEQQYEAVQPGSKSALAVHFELEKDWHFYASAKTAPGGMNLKIKPSAEDSIGFSKFISFSGPIFPQPHLYFDKSSGKKLEVFSDKFTIFLPFSIGPLLPGAGGIGVKISIEGASTLHTSRYK